MFQVKKQQVEGVLREETLMGGIVVFLTSKIPDAEAKSSSSYAGTVQPFIYLHPMANCGLTYTPFPQEMSYQCAFATNHISKDHELHTIASFGNTKLSV